MKFKNPVFDLPSEIKKEIDSLIESHMSGNSLHRSLVARYGTQVTVPSIPTLLKYIKYYNGERKSEIKQATDNKLLYKLEDGITEVDNVLVQISKGEAPNFSKIKLLEGLAAKCLKRVHDLENILKDSPKKLEPTAETVIVRYVTTIKDIMQSIASMSENQTDEKVLIQMIRTEARSILDVVKLALLDVCPEKYDAFRDVLQVKLKERGINVVQSKPATAAETQIVAPPDKETMSISITRTKTTVDANQTELTSEQTITVPVEQSVTVPVKQFTTTETIVEGQVVEDDRENENI